MNMKTLKSKTKPAAEAHKKSGSLRVQPSRPSPEALLQEAKNERKRVLLMEHAKTIAVLRDEKKFTFRAIAKWLLQRGIKVDHSAVYRTYLAAIPEEKRQPFAALQSRWVRD
jgi:uroporphyrinogen-III synthase